MPRDVLAKSVEELRAKLKEHEELLDAVTKESSDSILTQCEMDCPHRQELAETLLEAIEILEETKKAFKSKQLEMLRKKLIRVLANNVRS